MKVQNVFIICLLVLPLTCGMHETHLKPVLLYHKPEEVEVPKVLLENITLIA